MTLIENDNPKIQYVGPFTKGQLLPLTFPYIEKINVHMLIDGVPAEINKDFEIDTNAASARIKNDLPKAKQITLYRVTPLDQQAPFPQQGKFRSERVEQALDKLTMQQQEQEEQLSRCIIAPITLETFNGQLPNPAPDQALKWNSDGSELENYDIIGEQEAFEAAVTTQLKEQYNTIDNRIGKFEAAVTTQLGEQYTAIDNRIGEFEESANTQFSDFRNEITENLDAVLDAAGKLEVLDQQVQVAENAASQASAAAVRADQAVDEAESAADQAEEALTEVREFIQIAEDKYLDKSQITNCLLEVPQNIKLELADGVLTLKAGSKVIVPNGVGVFKELIISKDLTLGTIGTATLPSKLYVKADGSALVQWVNEASGATVPASGTHFGFYNTSDNTCKLYNADGTVAHTVSLPIANVHRTSGSWDKIEQVFNGFGYIGSTIWVDKGVKGLVPDGRYEDGSLKNIEARTDRVLVYTNINNYNRYYAFKTPEMGVWKGIDFMAIASLNSGQWAYDEDENYWKYKGNVLSWIPFALSNIDTNSPYTIQSFQPKQPFRAVDYNDLETEIKETKTELITQIDNKVNKTGDTMTGTLDISTQGRADINLYNKTLDQAMTTAPSSTQYYGAVRFFDKSNRLTGQTCTYIDTGNNANCAISALRNVDGTSISSTFTVMVKPDGTQTCAATAGVKSEITSWSYPSTTKITNPIPTTITKGGDHTYTAPCDGMLTFQYGSTTGANAILAFINGIQVLHIGDSTSSTHRMSGTLLVSRGMVIKINTDTREASGNSYFWYAKGTKV